MFEDEIPQYLLLVASTSPAAVVGTNGSFTCLYFALYTFVTPLFAKSGAATEFKYSSVVFTVAGSSVVQRISNGIVTFSPKLLRVSSFTNLSIPSKAPLESNGFPANRFR